MCTTAIARGFEILANEYIKIIKIMFSGISFKSDCNQIVSSFLHNLLISLQAF